MAEIIDRLRLDHQRFRQLLSQLAAIAENVNSGDVGAEDRLFCMIEYLKDYPHEVHHPIEDLVFAHVLKKPLSERQRNIITDNAREHRALERETKALFNNIGSTDALTSIQVAAYVAHQNEHMDREEREAFPLAEEVLTRDDLSILEEQHGRLHDPLFDAAERRFSALFECLDTKGLDLGAKAVASFLSATGR